MPIFYGEYVLQILKDLKKKNIVFSGIGSPQSFTNTLRQYGINIKSNIIFPDHYHYTKKDLERIKKLQKMKNLKILTTEKDFVEFLKIKKKYQLLKNKFKNKKI